MGLLGLGLKLKNVLKTKKVAETITSLKGKYNIGNAGKIKNKASRANLEASIFNYKQSSKKFKEAVDSIGALDTKMKKRAKEKIKTGKFNKYGNPSK